MKLKHRKINGEIIEGILLAALAIAIMIVSLNMNSFGSWALSPGLVPLIMGVILLILSMTLVYKGLNKLKFVNKDSTGRSPGKIKLINVILISGITLLFLWLLPIVHFVWATVIYMAVLLLLLGERRWWAIVSISAGTTGFIYYIFGILLNVMLP